MPCRCRLVMRHASPRYYLNGATNPHRASSSRAGVTIAVAPATSNSFVVFVLFVLFVFFEEDDFGLFIKLLVWL